MGTAKFLEDNLDRLEADLRALADDKIVDPIIAYLRSQPAKIAKPDDTKLRHSEFLARPIEIDEAKKYEKLRKEAIRQRNRRPVARSSELYEEIERLNREIIQLKGILARQVEELRKLRS